MRYNVYMGGLIGTSKSKTTSFMGVITRIFGAMCSNKHSAYVKKSMICLVDPEAD